MHANDVPGGGVKSGQQQPTRAAGRDEAVPAGPPGRGQRLRRLVEGHVQEMLQLDTCFTV